MKPNLSDYDSVFILLIALVKQKGGEIRITEEELNSVTTTDLITLLWDPACNEAVLKVNSLEDTSHSENLN